MKLNVEELNPKEGFTPITLEDLKKIEDNSVDELQSEDLLHISDVFTEIVDEFHRVLKQGGKLMIFVPYWNSVRAHADFRTKRVLNEGSFLVFNKEWREKNMKNLKQNISSNFDLAFSYIFDPDFDARSDEAKAFASKYYNNSVMAFQVIMTKK